MRNRRFTVRATLTGWYLLVLAVVITGFAAALYWDQERTLSAEVDRSVFGASAQVLALIDKHAEPIRFVEGDAYRHASSYLTQGGYAVLLLGPSRETLARFASNARLAGRSGRSGGSRRLLDP